MKKTIKGSAYTILIDSEHNYYVMSSYRPYSSAFLQMDGTWGSAGSRWKFAPNIRGSIEALISGYVDQKTMTPEERAERLKACGWDV